MPRLLGEVRRTLEASERWRRLVVVPAVVALSVLVGHGAAARAADEPVLGFNEDAVGGMHQVSPDQYAGLVRAVGGNTIRTNLDWRLAEPEPDVWAENWWGRWQELYDVSLARGVTPVFVIGFAPAWARDFGTGCAGPLVASLTHDPGFGACELPPRPAMNLEWAEYAAEVARRFPEAMIEVWNEPNTDDYWRPAPDPKRFAELLTLASHAVKAVSPRTEVVMGGLLNVRHTDALKGEVSVREFLSIAYSSLPSLEGSADYLGLHTYPSGAYVGIGSRFRQAFADVRAVRDSYGDETPILVTETGVSTADLLIAPERRQATAIERIQKIVDAMPDVAGVLYHRVVEPRDTSTSAREHGFAWLRYGSSPLQPRPVFCRFVLAAGRRYPGC
jgi:hypothetical protein